ncbi:MAG: N-acetyl-gamma-glutamyl-phosphate reductase [Chitinophagales bacterium]|nr:N-acetyl-gamma-glutamyl-phosphate reductase [Chitinophagales bacterium]
MKKRVGIIGAAGYAGGELVRLLFFHPQADLQYVFSRSKAGQKVTSIHKDLIGETDLVFTDVIPKDIDILFLALPHGQAKDFLQENTFSDETVIIDLSNDFRLKKDAGEFLYGLPELNRDKTFGVKRLANPGCFASTIELGLLPLAHAGLIKADVHVSAITGATGAGVRLTETTHFTWRDNNMSNYKILQHQHLDEISETIVALQDNHTHNVFFIPYRGDFSRGIIATIYTAFDGTSEDAMKIYKDYYASHPFTHVADENVDLKQVVNTNKCIMYPTVKNGQIVITSVLDNLLKGASGQAVQNMNLIMGWEETEGLKLKASVF